MNSKIMSITSSGGCVIQRVHYTLQITLHIQILHGHTVILYNHTMTKTDQQTLLTVKKFYHHTS